MTPSAPREDPIKGDDRQSMDSHAESDGDLSILLEASILEGFSEILPLLGQHSAEARNEPDDPDSLLIVDRSAFLSEREEEARRNLGNDTDRGDSEPNTGQHDILETGRSDHLSTGQHDVLYRGQHDVLDTGQHEIVDSLGVASLPLDQTGDEVIDSIIMDIEKDQLVQMILDNSHPYLTPEAKKSMPILQPRETGLVGETEASFIGDGGGKLPSSKRKASPAPAHTRSHKKRGKYKCTLCGVMKENHICSGQKDVSMKYGEVQIDKVGKGTEMVLPSDEAGLAIEVNETYIEEASHGTVAACTETNVELIPRDWKSVCSSVKSHATSTKTPSQGTFPTSLQRPSVSSRYDSPLASRNLNMNTTNPASVPNRSGDERIRTLADHWDHNDLEEAEYSRPPDMPEHVVIPVPTQHWQDEIHTDSNPLDLSSNDSDEEIKKVAV